jgi:hypothetical protein
MATGCVAEAQPVALFHPMTYQLIPIDTEWEPTAKQRAVIACYSSPPWPPFNEAARLQGVAVQTAKGWRRSPVFVDHIEAERNQALEQHLEQLRTRLAGVSTTAIDVLERAMESEDELSTAVRAAIWTLERTIGKAPDNVKHEGTVRFVLSPGDGHTRDGHNADN